MNPNTPELLRAEIEVRLTALLLGQLPAAEAELLRWSISQDAELAKLHEQLKNTIGLVREVSANPDAAAKANPPLKMSDERRQKLLAQFKTITPAEFASPPAESDRKMSWLLPLAAVLVIGAVLATMLLPSLAAAKRKSRMGEAMLALPHESDGTDGSEALFARARKQTKRLDAAKPPPVPNQGLADNRFPSGQFPGNTLTVSTPPSASPAPGNIVLPSPADTMTEAPASPPSAGLPTSGGSNPWASYSAGGEMSGFGGGGFGGRPKETQGDAGSQNSADRNQSVTTYELRNRQIAQSALKAAEGQIVVTSGLGNYNFTVQISTNYINTYAYQSPISSSPGKSLLQSRETQSSAGSSTASESPSPANISLRPWDAPALEPPAPAGIVGIVLPSAAPVPNNASISTVSATSERRMPDQTIASGLGGTDQNGGAVIPVVNMASGAGQPRSTRSMSGGGSGGSPGFDSRNQPEDGAERPGHVPDIASAQEKSDASILVQDGKSLYEMGKFSDAQAKLSQAIKMDPDNEGAFYYFNLSQRAQNANSSVAHSTDTQVRMQQVEKQWVLNRPAPSNVVSEEGMDVAVVEARRLEVERKAEIARAKQNQTNGGVPILGDVPVTGRLFSPANPNSELASLQDELKKSDAEIFAAQTNVDRLRESLHIDDNDPNSLVPTPVLSEKAMQNYQSQVIESERTFNALQAQLSELKALKPDQLRDVLPGMTEDHELSDLLAKLNSSRQQLATLNKDYGPADPHVAQSQSKISELEKEMDARVTGIMTAWETQVASKKSNLDALKNELVVARQADAQALEAGQPYWMAKRHLEELREHKQALEAKIAAQKLGSSSVSKPTFISAPQPEIQTKENAFSTFSLNVSDVSFKLAAASLEHGVFPPADSVRSEEFINAFDYRDPAPPAGAPVGFAWERAGDPFAPNRDFLRFSIKTAAEGRAAGRPLNLVLLLDKSGSMERADRVAIIREALRVLAAQLGPHDTLSVVTFARTAHLYADGVTGDQADGVFGKLSGITPEGGTNLEEAMNLAYQNALRHFLAGGVNRVVLMTDGAANLGNVDPQQFKQKVEANRQQGIALDCFGIGWEDYNDDLLALLANHGDGRYGFLNTPEEAASGFAAQLAGALKVAAADVKVQVEFNPARVTAYRQVGYASHQLTKQQFRDNTVDAAVIGAAESGNALYTVQINPQGDGPVATVRVRFRVPGTGEVQEHSWLVPYNGTAAALDQASPAMRLAAVAGTFAEWLSGSPTSGDVTLDQLLDYLKGVSATYGTDPRPQKLEWMIRQAKSASVSAPVTPTPKGGGGGF